MDLNALQSKKKVNQSGLGDKVTFTGYMQKQDVFAAYHAADVMLFPSKTETQGLTAVESIICGTPVVGLNEMGVKDVIKNNASGILTSVDVKEYANATIALLKDEKRLKSMSDQAVKLGQDYSYLKTNIKLEALYKSVVN